jgi:hypothetical protein
MLRGLALLLLTLFSFGCTKNGLSSNSGGSGHISPELTVQALNGQCLDLETIVHQMDDTGFIFPGYVYTRNFEVLGSSGDLEFTKTLMARSFRAEPVRMRGLGDLRGVKQNGCDNIVMADAGGLPLTYKITGYTTRDLDLELDTQALKDAMTGYSSTHTEVISEFPAVHKMTIKILAPTKAEIISTYRSIPIECPKVKSNEIREHLVYSWSGSETSQDRTALLDPAYLRRLNEIAGLSLRSRENRSQDLAALGPNESEQLSQSLQARPYAPCR